MAVDSIFKFATVVSTVDNEDGGRIKARIIGEEMDLSPADVPFAFPLLPKQLNVKPKSGELVMLFFQEGNSAADRFYLGPIISQPHKMNYDGASGDAFLRTGIVSPDVAPSRNPDNAGLPLANSDVALVGRGHSDVIVKDDQTLIRSGKSLDGNKTFNRKNPSYVRVRYKKADEVGDVNIVSNKINLLSYDGKEQFDLSNPNGMITDDEFEKILKNAHQLPFGDRLVQYLDLQRKAFLSHVHPYHGMIPDLAQIEIKRYSEFDLNSILSENVRIN
jgi:hypothetical protein